MSAHDVFTEALHVIQGGARTSSVIVAAIRSANLTVNEMGQILEGITERICSAAGGKYPEYPELEETANDLAEISEGFAAVQDRIDERKCNEAAEEIEHTETE